MSEFYSTFVTPFFAFFAIMSPLANAPVFLGLTTDLPDSERPAVAIRGVLVAFATVAAFSFGGTALLEMFGIDIAAVRAFGGLVVAKVGFELITKSAASFAVVALLNLLGFLAAERLVKRLGEDLTGAIGTQMVIDGVLALARG